MAGSVEPLFHKYVSAPLAVNVVASFKQIVLLPDM
ncbi:MAG: hypothetical protein BWY47_01455 [Bacteroidetes bacterium ADurb.Bin302]|nr:MAG: hypothetical protein BWY47_01455 [Bacteroidetes bacterium ADurb.Bin302]